MKTRKKERLENIALLNVIAILLVILGHSGCVYTGKWGGVSLFYNNSSIIRYITCYIYSFHMPLFVFISGYLYCYGKNTQNKYQSLQALISKKFKRLIIPYFIIGTFFMLPIYMIFHLDNVSSTYLKRVINEIILANDTRHLWFVLMLFNLFIIFYLIEKYINKNRIIVNLSILLIISILSVKLPNIYQISQSLQYLLFFYMGYIFYKHRDKVYYALKDKGIWFFIVHLFIFNFDYFIINNFNVSSNNVFYMKLFNLLIDKITAFIGIIFIFAMVQFLFVRREDRLHKLNNNKLFKNISKYNYFIYLVHQPIMLVMLKTIRNIPIKPIIVYNVLFWSTLFISLNLAKLYYFLTSFYKDKLRPSIIKKLCI